jgi:4-diphosphocytidyl-2-C-methyl-D-erythritol kinase
LTASHSLPPPSRTAVKTASLLSCAKINLGLYIIGKRPDGFHDIETVLQTIDLYDTIDITPLPGRTLSVRCDHPQVPSGPENLAYRAARLLQEEVSLAGGCDIEIRKRIPPAAGLGGGSSNAAVTLLGLNRLWNLKLSHEKLHDLAGRLGSDVPFFLRGGAAVATGRGDCLTPLRMRPHFWMVLIKPNFSIPTTWAYGRVKIPLTSNSRFVKLKGLKEICDIDHLLSLLNNDLEKAVGDVYPLIAEIKSDLLSRGAIGAAMSGSGSAVFGVVRTRSEARQLAQKMCRDQWQVLVVRPVRRCGAKG